MPDLPESTATLAAASAIADGLPVDWDHLPQAPTDVRVVEQLRVIEALSRRSDPVPRAWGPYAVEREIGQGAFGTVYHATDPALGIDIALKVVRGTAADGDASALNEARLLAQINHPNVVRVFGADRVGDDVGIAMELVRGRTLAALVSEQGPLPTAQVIALGCDICRGLAAVHAAGVLHGDVKASNVMRTGDGRTVLVDLGSGVDRKRNERPTDAIETGTPVYLAPEVLAGGERSQASDIYGLGVLLFHLATGRYPAGPPSGTPRSATRRNASRALAAVIDRAMAPAPSARYAGAAALETALLAAGERPPRSWVMPLAASALLLLGADAVRRTYMPGAAPPAPVAAASAVAAAGVGLPAAATPSSYVVEAAFFRHRGRETTRLQSGSAVAPGDMLSMQFSSSAPAHLYVVNEDERGAAFLLFPLPGQRVGNPVPASAQVELPGTVQGEKRYWQVTSAGGREHFLVFASPEPSPELERLIAELPPAAPDQTVLAVPLPRDLPLHTRGVGGTVRAPSQGVLADLAARATALLPASPETASGEWARRLTIENPRRP